MRACARVPPPPTRKFGKFVGVEAPKMLEVVVPEIDAGGPSFVFA